jgi:CheY-like chemotaxis protein
MKRLEPLLLIVDDDAAIRRAVTSELSNAGFAIREAADGEEGLRLYAEIEPDLVLTDLAMPRRDGVSLIRALRELGGTTPILVLSVRGEEEDKVRALDAGADDYLAKPFSLRELAARVRAQLRRAGGAAPPLRRFPGLEIDLERRRVVQGGREVRLTPTPCSTCSPRSRADRSPSGRSWRASGRGRPRPRRTPCASTSDRFAASSSPTPPNRATSGPSPGSATGSSRSRLIRKGRARAR